jgi:serine-type D-Ala-D-Ala carboxypeptidase (penicillin-binding protein 5/6)
MASRFIRVFTTILLILLLSFCLAEARQTAQKKGVPPVKGQARAAKEAPESCKAFAVMEAASGKIIEGENVTMRLPPASITKLMVALIVMEKLAKNEVKLSDPITISKAASKIGGSQVFLKEGEVFTLEELMKAMMIASANDAAYAIAEHLGGTKDEFVSQMNERAKSLNMAESEFHSPHGLPPSKGETEDLVSPKDLLTLSAELLRYPKILEWTSTKSEGFRGNAFTLNSTNKLLGSMPEVDGLKTGYFRQAGFSMVATAKRGDLRFVVAAMGCPTSRERNRFVAEKLKSAFAKYRVVQVVRQGEVIDKDVTLEDGKFRKTKGVAAKGFSYPLPTGKKEDLRKEIVVPATIKGEIREGQKLGEIVIYFEKDAIGKVDIISPVYIPKANLFTRLVRKLGLNL